jgi:hypothetical protein
VQKYRTKNFYKRENLQQSPIALGSSDIYNTAQCTTHNLKTAIDENVVLLRLRIHRFSHGYLRGYLSQNYFV